MIAAGDPQVFVPYGRKHLAHHPGDVYQPYAASFTDVSGPLKCGVTPAFQAIENSREEKWCLRSMQEGNYEEELYTCDRFVVWSKSGSHGTREIIKSFTVENVVQEALWCSFFVNSSKPRLSHEEILNGVGDKPNDSQLKCIAVVESCNVNIYTVDGEEYKTSLPFQVLKAWEMKYGLLFGRVNNPATECPRSEEELEFMPTVFSMLHPLDEVVPVVARIGGPHPFGHLRYCDPNAEIVFTQTKPSLLVLYHKNDNVHSVWRIRRATLQEAHFASGGPLFNGSHEITNTPTNHVASSAPQINGGSHHQHHHHTHTPSISSNFLSHQSTKNHASPALNSQSPSLTHMATLSRSCSPLPNGKEGSKNVFSSPHLSLLYPGTTTPNYENGQEYETELLEPLAPDICLDHIWSEPTNNNNFKASKVFLTEDLMGQNYLCLLIVELSQLRFIKFNICGSHESPQFIFGTVSVIAAKDAEPIPDNKMVLVLDSVSSLTLCTGPTKVCKVHVPALSSPFSSISGLSANRRFSCSSRRSSLATSSRPSSSLGTRFGDEITLSPVTPTDQTANGGGRSFLDVILVHSLRDGVRNTVTLETMNDTYVRISVPSISNSAIVCKCLQALKAVLPRDVAIQVFIKWYATRNAPGPSDLDGWSDLHSFLLCLLGLMGYDVDHLYLGGLLEKDLSLSPVAVKKLRTSEQGSDDDWNYLVSSSYNLHVQNEIRQIFPFSDDVKRRMIPENLLSLESGRNVNTNGLLGSYLPAVLFALHLVYEDCKLNRLHHNTNSELVLFLHLVARDLCVNLYLDYYWRDFPFLVRKPNADAPESDRAKHIQYPTYFTKSPPNIFSWVESLLRKKNQDPFPYIPSVTIAIRNVVALFAALCHSSSVHEGLWFSHFLKSIVSKGFGDTDEVSLDISSVSCFSAPTSHELILPLLQHLGWGKEDLEMLPTGIAVPLQSAILSFRKNPPPNLDSELYNVIGRPDLAVLSSESNFIWIPKPRSQGQPSGTTKLTPKEEDDGVDYLDHEVLGLLFPKDQRVLEVCRMLQSSKPVRILLQQRPEVSDHDFVDEQEKHLYSLCIRTMGLPIGRGMLTLRTYKPVPTETFPIPKLCLSGRSPPKNTTIELTHIEVPPNMNTWPLFHNGVAAGLRIVPNASQIDSTWIVYNKPWSIGNDTPNEHAGFLMALGLNGHLSGLEITSLHDYLCKGHEMTSVGLLLGIAATKRGTMDLATTKLMSIHLEALLPPTSTELDVPPIVQVAAVLGVGLLYQGSAHRHMAEVLLGEIGRPPGPEMEHCVDRESYAVAAGLALGLVTLGKGCELNCHSDMTMSDHLYHYMVGGYKRHLTGIQKEKYKSPSYQIREGECVNVDVTSPGATLALGMMFFNTGNRSVANWVTAPDTQYLLEMVRPDFLLLRTLSRGLIMWSEVQPSKDWIDSHVPQIVAENAFKRGERDSDIDYETMSQAYCNIIAGACMCLGLKFAGSANEEAFDALMDYAKMFIALPGKPVAEQAGKSTIETCMNVVVLSLAMVMAGTGDLEVMRICHYLRSRVGQSASYVLYGSHMATHMALGLLFLGGCRYTLSTSPAAIGAMLCAFFPKFPTHSNDNRYHLQAFRHLYVLAVEPRLIIPRDIDMGNAVYTHLRIKLKDTEWYQDVEYTLRAPCLLPDLGLLKEIVLDDPRYWSIVFNCEKNWKALKFVLESNGVLAVKQKAGCLPYKDDPKGFKSLLAQNIMKNAIKGSMLKPGTAADFSCDPVVANFASTFLPPRTKLALEREWQQQLCGVLFECASQEKMEALPYYLETYQFVMRNVELTSSTDLWQIRLILAFTQWLEVICDYKGIPLLRTEFVWFLKDEVEHLIQHFTKGQEKKLLDYLTCSPAPADEIHAIVPALVYHGIPPGWTLRQTTSKEVRSFPDLLLQLQRTCPSVVTVLEILRSLLLMGLDDSVSSTLATR